MTNKKQKIITDISVRVESVIADAGENPNSFAKKLGYHRAQTIYDIINGKAAPSFDFFRKFVYSEYSVKYNVAWLLTGKGEMCQSSIIPTQKEEQEKNATANESARDRGIPLVPLDVVARVMSDDNMLLQEYECEYYNIPVFRDADFLMQVTGDSMHPKYYSGDIIACRKLLLGTFFQWNRVYVIGTSQGVVIKRIHEGKDAEHIKLVSENTDYKPFEILLTDIRSIALVVGVVRAE